MKEIGSVSPEPCSPPDPRWELIERVSASSNLRKCPKLRGFLAYICENTFAGRLDSLREQLIGSSVFGRSADYDVTTDNIVRVEARELRRRLEAYFAGEGRSETVIIEIPRGSYVPVFKPRPPALQVVEPEGQSDAAEASAVPSRPGRGLVVGLAILSLVSTAAAIWLAVSTQRTQPLPPSAAGREEYAFYPQILGSVGAPAGRETLVVLSNPKVVLYYGADSKEPLVDSPAYTIPAPPQLRSSFGAALNNMDLNLPYQFLRLTRDDYTGMGEAVAAYHVGRLMQFLRRPVGLTQGRFLSWDRVQKQNLILLGSPQINDWTFRNVAKSNFNTGLRGVENLQPLSGEKKEYITSLEPGNATGNAFTDYAVIKMLTLPNGVNLLMMAGLTSVSTAGAGEFFATPSKMRAVYDRLRQADGQPFPPNWEVLIRMNVRDGLPLETMAIAYRPAPAGR